MKRLERGFTLIELLVVIAIIGILSSIVLASLNTARAKGADAATKSNLDSARAQAELYYDSNTQSYASVCSSTTGANGVRSIITNLQAAATAGGFTATPVTSASTAGAWNVTTCHDSQNAWAAEAPLKASASGAPVMWCIDNTGKSVQETTNLANTGAYQYACQ
jgi:prepilin-type N-terminal cleavage/methylation domain-containing protein